jgi:hypothetical protein
MDLALKSITLTEMFDSARERSTSKVKKAIYGVLQTLQRRILSLWRVLNQSTLLVEPVRLALLITAYSET